jgi:predicted DNA-binding transcriptional regulator AlpA
MSRRAWAVVPGRSSLSRTCSVPRSRGLGVLAGSTGLLLLQGLPSQLKVQVPQQALLLLGQIEITPECLPEPVCWSQDSETQDPMLVIAPHGTHKQKPPFTNGGSLPQIADHRKILRVVACCSLRAFLSIVAAMSSEQPCRDDDMLSRVQLAKALNVSTRTVDKWIAEGTAPPYTRLPGGMLRWRWGDVLGWLRDHRVEGP